LKILGNCKKENTITFFGNINIFLGETVNIIEHVSLTTMQYNDFHFIHDAQKITLTQHSQTKKDVSFWVYAGTYIRMYIK